jgi:hypothetical protein
VHYYRDRRVSPAMTSLRLRRTLSENCAAT